MDLGPSVERMISATAYKNIFTIDSRQIQPIIQTFAAAILLN